MTSNATDNYAKAVWQAWGVKLHGPKPTNDHLTVAHAFGRPGKQTMALAMMLRPEGATATQIKQVSALFDGNPTPHFNKARELVTGMYFTREATPGAFTLKLAPKGVAFIKNKQAGTTPVEPKAKPVKATDTPKVKPARVRKPRPAKPANKPAVVIEAPAGVMPTPAPVEQPQQQIAA